MKKIKPLTLGMLCRPWQQHGKAKLAVAALGFFRLGETAPRFLPEAEQWQPMLAALPAGKPFDEIHAKPHGEWLLAGKAYAPGGAPVKSLTASVRLGAVEKHLRVWGDRRWYYGPWYRIGEPAPFTAMPLVPERAFGGPRLADNPQGCGYTGNALAGWIGTNEGTMPNIELTDEPVKTHVRKLVPALLGPLEQTLPARAQWVGTYDEQWLLEDAPGLARNLDTRFFQAAPPDQWNADPWTGNETYRLENLSASRPIIEGQLPGFDARAFVRDKASGEIREVTLALDTIWFLPEAMLGLCIYHGDIDVSDVDARDIDALMVAYEASGQPKSLGHYHETLALRAATKTAALHAVNEAQLAPALPAHEQARRAAAAAQRQADQLAKQQAQLDAHVADMWQQLDMAPPADYTPPKLKPSPLSIDHASLAEGEADLAEWLANASALADQAKQAGEAQLEQAKAKLAVLPAAPAPEPAEQREKHYARAAAPAWDLVGGDDPNMARIDEALQKASDAGKPVDPADRAKMAAGLAQTPALQRQGKRMAPTPTQPPLDADTAQWLGEQVRQWQLGGMPLAGRDLHGAALAGIDFSGADLRETSFESADLRGARFARANLRGANFVGAHIEGADFSEAQLDEAGLNACHAQGARFVSASLAKAMACKADFSEADFSGAILDQAMLNDTVLSRASLAGASLQRTLMIGVTADASIWTGATLKQTLLLKADLSGADFRRARMEKAVMLSAKLDHSDWREVVAVKCLAQGASAQGLQGAGLRGDGCGWRQVDWRGADLSGACLTDCDLGEGKFDGARLSGGLFARCLLQEAKLADCDLQGANLLQAICRKADFRQADLRAACLRQAALDEADFTDARLDDADFDAPALRRIRHRLDKAKHTEGAAA